MALSEASLRAAESLPGTRISCSWDVGWRALLLRGYIEPLDVEEVSTAATADHLIVLVVAGTCDIESYKHGRWQGAHYQPGQLGMTPPDHTARLRWRSAEAHRTLQLHLPRATFERVAEELALGEAARAGLPDALSRFDPVIATTMLALEAAFRNGAPNLYAETAAHFLVAHLLTHHAHAWEPPKDRWSGHPLHRADRYLREHLSEQVSLGQIAAVVELSPFQVLRAAKALWGETPLRRLARLRMETARHLLERTALPIIDIALACGYSNPSHFATAFRRHVGVTPVQYRRR